jgi:hypothetical protein
MANPTFYNSFTEFVADGTIDLDTDTFGILLATSSYTIDKDHDFRNDITAEVTGTGYTAGGVTLTSVTWVRTAGANGFTTFDFADPSWANATISDIRYAVLYKRRGGASSADELVCVWDLGQSITVNGTEFKLVVPTTGAFVLKGL